MNEVAQAAEIRRVTLRYDLLEDRIRMDAEVAEGRGVTFWVTQRLSLQLILALLQHLTAPHPPLQGGGNVPASGGGEVHQFLQEKARAERKPAEPVDIGAAGDDGGVLLEKGQVRLLRDKRLQLILPGPGAARAVLTMTGDEARLLLDIFYQQFKVGGWPLDIWPEWIKNSSQGRGAKAGTRLH